MRIKGRSFVALVLMPEAPIDVWLEQLTAQMQRSPTFFAGRPVIVDLSGLAGHEAEFETLVETLERRDIRIIGVEGADPSWTDTDTWGRPPLLGTGRPDRLVAVEDDPVAAPDASPAPAEPPPEPPSHLHEGPVRSGQTVVFEAGDVVVIGSVASGAEVIAGGSVHVYGTLRGRAIAGFMGRPESRIFCRRLEAELLAIDGCYLVADDVDPALRGRSVQARRDGDALVVSTLD